MAVTPTISAISGGSRAAAAVRTVDGIAGVMDELKPGMTVWFWFSIPDGAGGVHLSGNSVSMSVGNLSVSQVVRWQLPAVTLDSGRSYAATLAGDSVEVTSGVRG